MNLPKNETKSKLLGKQVEKYLSFLRDEDYEKFRDFLMAVNDEYEYDKERLLFCNNALDVSTEELNEKNEELKIKTEQLSEVLEKNIQINERLEEWKKNLELIVNNLLEWIIVIDNDWKIIISNSSASKITGYSKTYLLHKDYRDIIRFVDEKWRKLDDFVMRTIRSMREYSSSRWVYLKLENREMPIFFFVKPLKKFTSKGTACIIVFKDITEEKRLENLKNEFLSIASHELRTPMTVIRWYVSLFIKGKLWDITDNQKEYLEKIFMNTVRLIDMVNDMLDINKLEAWKMEFSYDIVNITKLVENCVDDMKWLFEQKGISLEIDLFSDLISVSDEWKIKQVLMNLLSNAYKFTNEGWKVKVGLNKDDNFIKFFVKDNWVWIAKRNMNKLFKKFSQIGSYLNKWEKWTWLWLSLCKQIVEEMGGSIFVDSVINEWSIFSFILPYKKWSNFN